MQHNAPFPRLERAARACRVGPYSQLCSKSSAVEDSAVRQTDGTGGGYSTNRSIETLERGVLLCASTMQQPFVKQVKAWQFRKQVATSSSLRSRRPHSTLMPGWLTCAIALTNMCDCINLLCYSQLWLFSYGSPYRPVDTKLHVQSDGLGGPRVEKAQPTAYKPGVLRVSTFARYLQTQPFPWPS